MPPADQFCAAVDMSNKSVPDPVGFTQLKDLSDLIIDACE
jgi:hypothetical protein